MKSPQLLPEVSVLDVEDVPISWANTDETILNCAELTECHDLTTCEILMIVNINGSSLRMIKVIFPKIQKFLLACYYVGDTLDLPLCDVN